MFKRKSSDSDKTKRKRHKLGRRIRRGLLLGLVGGGSALAFSEGLRGKVLDALFGAEEEFEYSPPTDAATGDPASEATD